MEASERQHLNDMMRLEQRLKLKLNPEFHCRLCSISVTSTERVLTLTAAFLGGGFEECNNDIRGMVSQIVLGTPIQAVGNSGETEI